MSIRRLALASVMCCMVPTMARAEGVVELMPGDTLGYVTINRLADTDQKIQAMGKQLNLPIPSLVSLVKMQSGIAEGVDEAGSMGLALLPTNHGPSAVIYIAVDDYAAFIEQLDPEGTENDITTVRLMGRQVIVGKKASHAVVAWPSNRALLQKVLSDEAAGQAATDITKTLRDDHDVSGSLSSEGVKVLTALGQKGLEEAKAVVQAQSDKDNPALAGIEVYVHLLNAIGSEVSSAAFGLKLEDGGSLRVNEWVWIQPDGKTAPMLQGVKSHDGDLLAGLPNIPYVVAVGGVLPSGAVEPMMDFSRNLMKAMPQVYGLTPEQVDKMIDLSLKYFPDLHSMSFFLGAGREDAPLYSEMLGVMHVPDARDYVDDYQKFWEELDDVIGDAEGSFLSDVKIEDVKLDGVPVLKVSMPIPSFQGLDLPNQEDLDGLMEKLYGPGGITIFMAAADEDKVLMGYTDMEILRKALRATKDKTQQISQDSNVVYTAEQLPTGAHMVGYWSPSGTIAFANRAVKVMSGPERGIELPVFPDAPPVGWAMTATPSLVKFNTIVPAETIKAASSFAEKVQQLDAARRAGE